jgi:regulation of enolase protein 1 (concanavalin A-like superfamily)
MTWFNEPQNWKQENDHFFIFADAHTDFWRKTHYGFIRDNGHFYYEKVTGNFEVETEFRGRYQSLYDQAGVMVRLEETTWDSSCKCRCNPGLFGLVGGAVL